MMSATRVLEFETHQGKNRYGEPAGMKVRIEVGDDTDFTIIGTSTGAYDGESYLGTLTFRKAINGYEGGDECWINGVWVSPCPTNAEGDDPPEMETTSTI
jgi:hypothetical protein